jgi:hypothetical protein
VLCVKFREIKAHQTAASAPLAAFEPVTAQQTSLGLFFCCAALLSAEGFCLACHTAPPLEGRLLQPDELVVRAGHWGGNLMAVVALVFCVQQGSIPRTGESNEGCLALHKTSLTLQLHERKTFNQICPISCNTFSQVRSKNVIIMILT